MMMKTLKVYLFIYDNFADFEVVQALLLLQAQKISTIGFQSQLYKSACSLKIHADYGLKEVNPSDVDVLIIPGGEPKNLILNQSYKDEIACFCKFLSQLANQGSLIAGICGGPVFMAHAGILDEYNSTASISLEEKVFFKKSNFLNKDVVVDGNRITAKGQAFTDFAIEIGKYCGVFKDQAEIDDTIKWFRNIK